MQVDVAEAQGKHVILLNPSLKDVPSSSGVMGVRCAGPARTQPSSRETRSRPCMVGSCRTD